MLFIFDSFNKITFTSTWLIKNYEKNLINLYACICNPIYFSNFSFTFMRWKKKKATNEEAETKKLHEHPAAGWRGGTSAAAAAQSTQASK